MSEMRYTQDHEWTRKEGEDIVAVGISDFAQEQLGEVVFVELPEVGATVAQGDEAGVVESVKAASEIYAPLSGEVVEVNEALPDQPELVNSDPTGEAWFFKLRISDASELEGLMDESAYQEFCAESA